MKIRKDLLSIAISILDISERIQQDDHRLLVANFARLGLKYVSDPSGDNFILLHTAHFKMYEVRGVAESEFLLSLNSGCYCFLMACFRDFEGDEKRSMENSREADQVISRL